MCAPGRWIVLSSLILAAGFSNASFSQEHASTLSIDGQDASVSSSQSKSTKRTPERWIAPLPHIAGSDDPALHSMGLVVPDSIQRYWRTHVPHLTHTASIVPTAVDWSSYDSPVKAQGRCGACWAFAAVAAVENAARLDDLSEQVLISCSGAGSCAGGYYEEALSYIYSLGLPAEENDPYTETNGNCASKNPSPPFVVHAISVTTSMWGDIAQLNGLKAALQNGPVIVRMVVYLDFDAYKGGIYHHTTGPFQGYHAVLVVGYNDDERCFKAKNSWGTAWGEGGYFRISYDDLANEVEFGGYGAQVTGAHTEYLQTTGVAGTGNGEAGRAGLFTLEQNYPNPFNPATTIKYTVGGSGAWGVGNGAEAGKAGTGDLGLGASRTRLAVYDVLGREVAVLVDERKAPGHFEVSFDGSGLASGVYIYQLRVGDLVQSRQMILMK